MPLRGRSGDSNSPVAIVCYIHLPVAAACRVTRPAQDARPVVEALRAVRQVGFFQTFLNLLLVIREQQPGVGRQRVEGNFNWGMSRRESGLN